MFFFKINVKKFSLVLLLTVFSTMGVAHSLDSEDKSSSTTIATPNTKTTQTNHRSKNIKAQGETGNKIEQYRKSKKSNSLYSSWKRKLPFWIRKIIIFTELALYIIIGVILGQMLEVAGIVKYIAIITKPLLFLGGLPSVAGPPFILSLQSGAVANSMLVGARDEGEMSNRQLYTSVFVVSCLSLFAHLPTYIIPLGIAFGSYYAWIFFAVRFGAILVEILIILLISNLIFKRFTGDELLIIPRSERLEKRKKKNSHETGYLPKVWARSRRTIRRILLYTTPSFFGLALLEYFGFFIWLKATIPGIFSYSFLPAEASAIIPAQAINLYNGIITAGNFLDEGKITAIQAIIILLAGSILTSPIRTLKHALPTYIGILGPKPGLIMAISAQFLRVIFIGSAIVLTILLFQ